IVLRVKDTGVGIDPVMLPRIFDLFVQGERSLDRPQGGVGVGLTLVRRLVELHGGTVQARSPGPGQGSEFIVRLPAARDVIGPEERPAAEDETFVAGPSRRILVVDDNQDAADSLAAVLSMAGHEVRVAYGGEAALALASEFRPVLVFLDIGMPGMDGYQVARRIRQPPGGDEVVLVALTGWGQEEDLRRSREAGFDHHLVKPVEPATLQKILQGR